MHIAFAVIFFLLIGVSESLRLGFIGLNPTEATALIYACLAFGAVLILRNDCLSLVRSPKRPLYGNPRLHWTWKRTVLGLFLAPLLCLLPILYGLTLIQIKFFVIPTEVLIEAIAYQVVFVALAEELFFREAAIKAYGQDIRALFVASGLACFIFYYPTGLGPAMMAGATGIFFLSLRLTGMNILAVALAHGTLSVVMTQVIPAQVGRAQMWPYAIYFTVSTLILALVVVNLFAPKQRELRYA